MPNETKDANEFVREAGAWLLEQHLRTTFSVVPGAGGGPPEVFRGDLEAKQVRGALRTKKDA